VQTFEQSSEEQPAETQQEYNPYNLPGQQSYDPYAEPAAPTVDYFAQAQQQPEEQQPQLFTEESSIPTQFEYKEEPPSPQVYPVSEPEPAPEWTDETFPTFEEYFTKKQPASMNGNTITLDNYLNGNIPDEIMELVEAGSSSRAERREMKPPAPAPPPKKPEPPAPVPQSSSFDQFINPTPAFDPFGGTPAAESSTASLFDTSSFAADPFAGYTSAETSTETPQTPSFDLDDVTEKLQNVERIKPQENYTPTSQPPAEEQSPYSSDMVTSTLAEIYASQGEYGAAIQAYEILMLSQPENVSMFENRIKELQKLQAEKESGGA
jgi:hypothetical protein